MLNRVIGALVCAASLFAGGAAIADQPQDGRKPPVAGKPDPTLTPREITEREQEYLAALRKCEPLAESERQTCVKAVKEKYGLM